MPIVVRQACPIRALMFRAAKKSKLFCFAYKYNIYQYFCDINQPTQASLYKLKLCWNWVYNVFALLLQEKHIQPFLLQPMYVGNYEIIIWVYGTANLFSKLKIVIQNNNILVIQQPGISPVNSMIYKQASRPRYFSIYSHTWLLIILRRGLKTGLDQTQLYLYRLARFRQQMQAYHYALQDKIYIYIYIFP